MNCLVLNHYTSLNRQMRKGHTVSLDAIIYGEETLYLEEVLPGPDRMTVSYTHLDVYKRQS